MNKIKILNRKIVSLSLLSVFAFIFSVGIFMQSCSNEDDIFRDAPPKLKSLMTSSEYVNLNQQMKSLGKELRTNYKKLSETEKERVMDILHEMKKVSDDQGDIDKLLEEFHFIMKFDFKTATEKISEGAVRLRLYNEQNNISNQEFVLAVTKYPNGGIPRLKNGGETDTADCVENCIASTLFCMTLCLFTGPGIPACDTGCMAGFAFCCWLCPD